MEKTITRKSSNKKTTKQQEVKVELSARDRIKPRGLAGLMKGKIHYDRDADIFNLGPL